MILITLLGPQRKGDGSVQEDVAQALQSIPDNIEEDKLLWLDVQDPKQNEIEKIQQRFSLDPYAIEDVIHGKQRPKVEEYKGNNFSVIHFPVLSSSLKQDRQEANVSAKRRTNKFTILGLYVFFGDRWLITVHDTEVTIIQEIDRRVKERGLSPLADIPSSDLLYYVFLDFAVDAYYPALDSIEGEIEGLEKQAVVVFNTRKKRLENVNEIMTIMGGVREELAILRRNLSPTRDMLGQIMRGVVPFVADASLRNFRDIYDHTFQLIETIDTYRDRTSDVRDLYISLLAASTDNILKTLTIVATILLPLSLLTGIYGMNFTPGFYEPGSGLWYGFYILMAGMLVISLALAYMFRKAGWI
jgi:magnesium transporter